jgi:MFS family permease
MAGGIVMVSIPESRLISELFCFFTGVGASAIFPLVASYTGRFPEWFSGVVFSFGYLAAAFGAMSLPYLAGPVADICGFRVAMAMAAVPPVLVALIAIPIDRSASAAPKSSR